MSAVIPEGWVNSKLECVVDTIVGGGTPSKAISSYFQGDIPWMSVKDMNKNELVDTVDHISQEAVENSSTNVIPAGTPIVATRMSLGKIVIANFDSAINQDLKALFVNLNIEKPYFVYWYRSIANLIESLGTGTTVKGIRLEVLRGLDFPLPPLAEQKVIADKLDELLAQVESTKARLDAIPAILKSFRQSVLAAAVSGKLIPSVGYRVTTVGEVAQDIRYGTSKKCDYNGGVTPVIRIPNIGNRKLDVSDLKSANFSDKELDKLALQEDDLLLIRSNGSVELVAKPALVEKQYVGFLFAGYLIRIRCNQEHVLPSFLLNVLCSRVVRDVVEIGARSTSGVNNINSKELASLEFVLPSLKEQNEIVRRVDELFAFADKVEAQVNAAQARVNNLTQSILAKAFKGELTADWRAANPDLISGENSAEALLERIKAEREAIKKQPKPKRTAAKKKTGSSMSKQIIKVVEALKEAGKPLSGQQLLAATGYPSDSNTEQLERFFLDIRDALTVDKSIVKVERSDDEQDWFALAKSDTNE
ncbi:restriction endonuclease subunit S [Enterovibrio norvegicus]|uniref:restriction endonuclease subunit S n=1 Tax=Enterovibrio norvegicus TaxID=188144 RepID=UPI00035D522F|nr:restriction endonuclease subunit S [Enterovibrio norvegicus]OEF54916.1 hypothetical protein A1OU_21200 [Enterovibrio norvegicus]